MAKTVIRITDITDVQIKLTDWWVFSICHSERDGGDEESRDSINLLCYTPFPRLVVWFPLH